MEAAEPPAAPQQQPLQPKKRERPAQPQKPSGGNAQPAAAPSAKADDSKDHIAPTSVNIAKLQAMSMTDLNQMARDLGVENFGTMRKHEVIFHILQKNAERAGVLFSEGVLEILPEGFGFLRSQSFNYLPCPEDIYVSPSQIRRFDLQTGNLIAGQIRPPEGKGAVFRPAQSRGRGPGRSGQGQGQDPFRQPDPACFRTSGLFWKRPMTSFPPACSTWSARLARARAA